MVKLLELLGDEKKPIYQFGELDLNQDIEKLSCYGFEEKNQEDWRKIALETLKEVSFTYEKYKFFGKEQSFLKGNISEMEKRLQEYLKNLDGLKFLKYHDIRDHKKWFHERGGFFDVVSLVGLGFSMKDIEGGIITGGIFATCQLINELIRRKKIKLEKSKIDENKNGIRKYQNMKEQIQEARIDIYTPQKAKEIIEKIREIPQYLAICEDKANEDLNIIYSKC